MIGNKYLQEFYNYPDENTALNQLLELLKSQDMNFINSLKQQKIDIEQCNDAELSFLIKASALIDYYLQLQSIEVPQWLRNDKLKFEKPYYVSKRLNSFDKVRLQYTNPAPFRARNVYYDLEGIVRV
jgi:hypothetical protein